MLLDGNSALILAKHPFLGEFGLNITNIRVSRADPMLATRRTSLGDSVYFLADVSETVVGRVGVRDMELEGVTFLGSFLLLLARIFTGAWPAEQERFSETIAAALIRLKDKKPHFVIEFSPFGNMVFHIPQNGHTLFDSVCPDRGVRV